MLVRLCWFGLCWLALWMTLYLRRSDRVSFVFPQYNPIKQVLVHGDRDQRERFKLEDESLDDEALEESHALNGQVPQVEVSDQLASQVEMLRHEVAYNERTLLASESYLAKMRRFFRRMTGAGE